MTHRGQVVEVIIRKRGYNLTKLAEILGVTRNTLYNKFKKADLNYRFIMQVGKVIRYDFTLDFPEMKEEPGLIEMDAVSDRENKSGDLCRLENKYTSLLERYSRLLEIITKVAIENGLYPIGSEIQRLIEENVDASK